VVQEKIRRSDQKVAGRVDDGPGGIKTKRPFPPVIKTTLARAGGGGITSRTGGVLTLNVVSMVTASAALAEDAAPQNANAKNAPRTNAGAANIFSDGTII
jgi:hypothetical protein